MEILRRLILLAGVFGFLWFFFDSPPALLRVRSIDFERELKREYGKREKPYAMGAVEMGQALVRDLTRPTSLEQYIARETEGRQIDVGGSEWEKFFIEVKTCTGGEAAPGGTLRVRDGYAFYGLSESPLLGVLRRIREIYGSRQSIVSYLAFGPSYIETRYETKPRELKAPGFLQHPMRHRSWWFLVTGVLFYALLPWPKLGENAVSYDRIGGVFALDFLGVLTAALFFGIPLYAADSTAAILSDNLRLTLFLWILALGGCAILAWAAQNASFRVNVLPDALKVSGLSGSRDYSFASIHSATYLKDGDVRTGITFNMRDGSSLRFKWDTLTNFERVIEALKSTGIILREPSV